jgi:hypothetical protein
MERRSKAKRGPKPRRIKSPKWSAKLAYAIGLIATDGCLYNNGRHIEVTSKDIEQLLNLKECLGLETKVTYKHSGYTGKRISRIQFGDVTLYDFLLSVGLMPAKTKTLGALIVPEKYFFDFLRGHHDGDGTFYSYWDPRWRSSFMYYLVFISASKDHIDWIRQELRSHLKIAGHITKSKTQSIYQLKYAKSESLKILRKMYYKEAIVCLSRKRLKIERVLRIVGEHL